MTGLGRGSTHNHSSGEKGEEAEEEETQMTDLMEELEGSAEGGPMNMNANDDSDIEDQVRPVCVSGVLWSFVQDHCVIIIRPRMCWWMHQYACSCVGTG